MNPEENRTAGEALFEQYLATQSLPFEFEKEYTGKSKRPDYSISWRTKPLVFDLKDFDASSGPPTSFGALDPYTSIREKINQGRDKFKEFKEYCCGLVLYNAGHGLVLLQQPEVVLGSMYGDSGFTFPINTQTGVGDSTKMTPAFLGGGKMLRPNWNKPQNTTISAVITLAQIRPHYLRLLDMIHEYPGLSHAELQDEAERNVPNYAPDRTIPRVIVWHNAVARIPFPAELFCGPYDTHFGIVERGDGAFQQVTYRGDLLPSRVKV